MPDAPATTEVDATSTEIATTTNTPPGEPPELGDAGKTALEAERRARREAEKQAKTAQAELTKLREATQSESEKALQAAKAEGRTEALKETGVKLVDAEVRAATAGRHVDADALLEGLDRTKFLDAQGDPDRDAIVAWIDRIAPAPSPEDKPGFPDLSQGTRQNVDALGSNPLTETLKAKLGIR